MRSWPVTEVNGFIFIWYHAENEEPQWQVPAIDEIESNKWIFRGRTVHSINCHIQVITRYLRIMMRWNLIETLKFRKSPRMERTWHI